MIIQLLIILLSCFEFTSFAQIPPQSIIQSTANNVIPVYDPLFTIKTAMANSSTGIVQIVALGDSITLGAYATESWFENNYIGRLRIALQSKYGDGGVGYIPSYRIQAYGFTNHNCWPYPTNANGSLNLSYWGFINAPPDYSGPFNKALQTTGNTDGRNVSMVNETFNSFDVIYCESASTSSGTNTAHVDVDGSTVDSFTISSSFPPVINRRHINVSGNNSTISIYPPSSGRFVFIGFCLYSANTGIQIHELGYSAQAITNLVGGGNGNWNDTPYQQTNMSIWFSFMKPSLTILAMTVNDYRFQTFPSWYASECEMVVSNASLYGSVLCIALNARDPTSFSPNTIPQSTYNDELQNVALKYNAAYCNIMAISPWETWITANNAGYMFDTVHPNNTGHTVIANIIGELFP